MTDRIVLTSDTPGESSRAEVSPAAEPIRIAFCITDLDIGGAERMLVELVTRLDRRKWEPHVFCLSKPGKLVEQLEAARVPTVCFGVSRAWQIGVIRCLAKELRAFRPALLQCFLFHANLAGRIAAKWAGVRRVVCGIRVAERRSRIPLWLDRLTQGLVNHNVCVSQGVAEFSIRNAGLRPDKISVIPNAVDFQRFADASPICRDAFGIPKEARVILFVGRLEPQKSPFLLLETFDRLRKRHPDWHLVLVGNGPLKPAITSWITANQLETAVTLAGWRGDIPSLLKGTDCLVLPSQWEGMPNVVLEAMAAGLPVVVSKVEGTKELIEHGTDGLLFEPDSRQELECQIETLLTDSRLALTLAKNAQLKVRKFFTFESMVAAYEHVYRCLLS